jgi:hypothetical protein
MSDKRNVQLPEHLCAQAERKFGGHFSSIDELLAGILTELLRDESTGMDEREQKIIEERLKGLGYI